MEKRAEYLNQRLTVAEFENIPEPIVQLDPCELLKETLRHNWCRITKKMHRGLKSRADDVEATTLITFGVERVRRGHSMYINMYALPPLIHSLFGVDCSLVKDKFLVQRTKRLSIIHWN